MYDINPIFCCHVLVGPYKDTLNSTSSYHHAINDYECNTCCLCLLIIYPGSVHSMKLTLEEVEDSDEEDDDNTMGY